MTTPPKWGGRKAQKWTQAVLFAYGTVCHLQLEGCTQVATTGDHIIPRSVRLDLQYDVTNGRPACRPCNRRRGDTPIGMIEASERPPSTSASPDLSPRFANRRPVFTVDNEAWFDGGAPANDQPED